MRLLVLALSAALSGCIIVDLPFGGDGREKNNLICYARHGGESDHLCGERWFDSTQLCSCDDVDELDDTGTTRCTDTCQRSGVRFVDTDGVVCACVNNTLQCEADADDGTPECNDDDDDGVCD
jgi:hypothetical protein